MAGIVLVKEVTLLLVHIQTRSAYLLLLDAGNQILGVNQSTPGGIDDGDTFLHLCDGVGADDVLCFFGQGAVEGNNVGLRKKLVQGNIFQPGGRIGIFVIGNYLHAKAFADVRKHPANLAGADNTHRLAVQIEAHKALEAEIKVSGADIGLVRSAVDGQQQRHGVLRNRMGGVGGNPEYPDFPLTGSNIHIVETGAPQHQQLHAVAVQLLYHSGVHCVVDEHAHGIIAVCQGNGVLVQPGLEVFDFQAGALGAVVKAGNIIGFCIEKCKLHF